MSMTAAEPEPVQTDDSPSWLKILRAAQRLENGQPFTANALVVAAWQLDHEAFGLEGHAEYPDSNRVLWILMGQRGLVRRGLLERVGPKLYRLTSAGRDAIQSKLKKPIAKRSAPRPRATMAKAQEPTLRLMLSSAALDKHREGRKDELTFADACAFWGIGEQDAGSRVDARLALVETALRLAERSVEQGELTLSDGRVVAEEEVEAARRADDYLRVRFTRHIDLIRARKQ